MTTSTSLSPGRYSPRTTLPCTRTPTRSSPSVFFNEETSSSRRVRMVSGRAFTAVAISTSHDPHGGIGTDGFESPKNLARHEAIASDERERAAARRTRDVHEARAKDERVLDRRVA